MFPTDISPSESVISWKVKKKKKKIRVSSFCVSKKPQPHRGDYIRCSNKKFDRKCDYSLKARLGVGGTQLEIAENSPRFQGAAGLGSPREECELESGIGEKI